MGRDEDGRVFVLVERRFSLSFLATRTELDECHSIQPPRYLRREHPEEEHSSEDPDDLRRRRNRSDGQLSGRREIEKRKKEMIDSQQQEPLRFWWSEMKSR